MADSMIALLDSCVLYPAPLRDLLMWLAITDLFQARWSLDIHKEWMSNLLANRPDLRPEKIERTRSLMDAHVEDCLVTGYEDLVERLNLPDPDDRHVLAAAIRAHATVIVTFNLSDFPEPTLSAHGLMATHPDEFVCMLMESAPDVVRDAAEEHRLSLKDPPKTREQYVETLRRQGLRQTAERLIESWG
jgi:predicted nucleic acid-binding protein